MAVKTKGQLKAYFQTGLKPTQAQFEDLIDSTYVGGEAVLWLESKVPTKYDAAVCFSTSTDKLAYAYDIQWYSPDNMSIGSQSEGIKFCNVGVGNISNGDGHFLVFTNEQGKNELWDNAVYNDYSFTSSLSTLTVANAKTGLILFSYEAVNITTIDMRYMRQNSKVEYYLYDSSSNDINPSTWTIKWPTEITGGSYSAKVKLGDWSPLRAVSTYKLTFSFYYQYDEGVADNIGFASIEITRYTA